ncbi:MAG: single-stranded-DNA-specific exonuclease RecJ [Cyanobacteria bacterium J06621_8]
MDAKWQMVSTSIAPIEFITGVSEVIGSESPRCAQLLWQRGIQDLRRLPGFLDPALYEPSSPQAFGQEMEWAIARLQQARELGEKVTIWGDFDADGITSTSVLWDGLGQFLPQHLQLDYYVPNRHTESHGLNSPGIGRLAAAGTQLIVTCDTGSTNLEEIAYANELGLDIIVTDHHTLPESRPDVVAIINPRYLPSEHPLFHLSGVAVAYKFVEGLYAAMPEVPQQPLEHLLDLVAIGLIADLVELSGDCRYLAQVGINQLKKQTNPQTRTRPGIAKLLNLCKKNGDRPTDISFGLGPRINAVSRIYGDANFCIELLTSQDPQRCSQLAEEVELANTRRKALQKDTITQVTKKLQQLDLSTTSVIVLEDPQWQGGVLGLAAGQIAQEYGRPTVLLSSGGNNDSETVMVRGSARSVNGIDLYQLVKSQEDLLHRFGGHPFAAGLCFPLENLKLFREGINQQFRQGSSVVELRPQIDIDLEVTVADLGRELFEELRQLEPYGMGNPLPKLLIKDCWFKNPWHKNIKDNRGNKIQYIQSTFEIWDNSVRKGFPGLWWGHYKDEIPTSDRCEAIAELDFNTFNKRHEIRLVAVRPSSDNEDFGIASIPQVIDRRYTPLELQELEISPTQASLLQYCPDNWNQIHRQYHQAVESDRSLVLAYTPEQSGTPEVVWQQLVGIAKYLSRTQKTVTKSQLQNKLNLGEASLNLGLNALIEAGFDYELIDHQYYFAFQANNLTSKLSAAINLFYVAIREEQFQQEYFYQVPLSTINQQLQVNI